MARLSVVEQRINRELGVESPAEAAARRRADDRHRPEPRPLLARSNGDALVRDPRAIDFAGGGLTVEDGILTVPSYGMRVGGVPSASPSGAGSISWGTPATDEYGIVQLLTTGAGLAAGNVLVVTFGVARATADYVVTLTPASAAARSLGGVVGFTSRTGVGWTLVSASALSASQTYAWAYAVRG